MRTCVLLSILYSELSEKSIVYYDEIQGGILYMIDRIKLAQAILDNDCSDEQLTLAADALGIPSDTVSYNDFNPNEDKLFQEFTELSKDLNEEERRDFLDLLLTFVK